MPGGKREGAGRKKGIPNKSTQERMAALLAGGESPLEYMLRMMRDQTQEYSVRNDMAKAAAPYMHARLASTEITGDPAKPLKIEPLQIRFVSGPGE